MNTIFKSRTWGLKKTSFISFQTDEYIMLQYTYVSVEIVYKLSYLFGADLEQLKIGGHIMTGRLQKLSRDSGGAISIDRSFV